MSLNPPQREAVECRRGPLLVNAGPGSGKTRTVMHRTGSLIVEDQVDPQTVLLVTFTRKAAKEMRTRLRKIVGSQPASQIWAGTFHATCAKLLRQLERDIDREGRKKDFVIYDQSDSRALVKDAIKSLNLDTKIWNPKAVQSRISLMKNAAMQPHDLARTAEDDERQRIGLAIWKHYEQQLLKSNGYDYDDLQLVIMRLLESGVSAGRALQHRFEHITVDEYQDTNQVQFRIVKAMARSRNLCVVGDHRQCIPAGQMVRTHLGQVPIEEIRVGDSVATVKGGRQVFRNVVAVSWATKGSAYEYDLGEHGSFQATKEHILFASIDDPRGAFVYLMYRPDMGFRLGVSRTAGHRGTNFVVRTQQEQAERLWVLAWYETYAEGAELEAHLAYEFQVPREPFKSRSGMWADGPGTERLFAAFGKNGQRVLASYGLSFYRPNYVAKTSGRHGRVAVNLVIGTKDFHRVEVETSHVDEATARTLTMKPTARGTYRLRVCTRQLAEAEELAADLAKGLGGYVVQSLSGTKAKRRMLAVPAASVHPGMCVPVLVDGVLTAVPVLGRRTVDAGDCYDLQIDELGTFAVNDVIVHNSIYAFRGADVRNILSFTETYHDAKVVDLDINYRSTPQIVDVFNAFFADCNMTTPNPSGPAVRATVSGTGDYEASDIVSRILALLDEGTSPGEIAVLYRLHALSRAIEEQLRDKAIRYQIVGGLTFYERSEVKDVLGYLRLVVNPHSNVDLQRVINVPPRAVSAKTVDKIRDAASLKSCSMWDAIPTVLASYNLSPKAQQGLRDFQAAIRQGRGDMTKDGQPGKAETLDLFGHAHSRPVDPTPAAPELSIVSVAHRLLDTSGYREYWRKQIDKLATKRKPVELERAMQKQANVEEVVASLAAYADRVESPTLAGYLEEVALMSEQDKLGDSTVSLMTVHASKGLEYDAVFVVGCEEGMLPFSKAVTPAEIEEEKRLMFVACSRARKHLWLTTAATRFLYGEIRETKPSRFLRGLPEEVDMDPWLRRRLVNNSPAAQPVDVVTKEEDDDDESR